MKAKKIAVIVLMVFLQIALFSCATNRAIVAVPEWATASGEAKWTDESGLEASNAEYMTDEGAKLYFEANAENLSDGEEVFAYIYRSNAKDKDDFVQKVACKAYGGKVRGETLIKESNEFLESLSLNDTLAYFFVLGSQVSKPIPVEFAFCLFIWTNPYNHVQNDAYVLEDIKGGKKYSQRKYCDDDKIPVDEEHFYLKFTDVKPGFVYRIWYYLGGGKYGNIQYENLSFVRLMGE